MRRLGEERHSWGDYVSLDSEADLNAAIAHLADQQRRILIELARLGELEYPITLGWKAREIGEEDRLAAEQWLQEHHGENS